MSEDTMPTGTARERGREDDRIDLLDHVLAIWTRRRLVAGVFALGVLGGLTYFLLMPKMYEGVASILPPKESGSGALGGLAAVAGGLPVAGLLGASTTPAKDNFVSILKSSTVGLAAVERFKLKERYEVDYVEDALKLLQTKRVTIESVPTEPTVTVKVLDADPKIAAELANFYVSELDKMVREFSMTDATRNRQFLTVQLARAKTDLSRSTDDLRRFQERHHAIGL